MDEIIISLKNISVSLWILLNDIFIIHEYEIDKDAPITERIKIFILRYRRIIGVILFCILLYIMIYCENYYGDNNNDNNNDNDNDKNMHKGGGGSNMFGSLFEEDTKQKKIQEAKAAGEEKRLERQKKKEAIVEPNKGFNEEQYKKQLEIDNRKSKLKEEYEAKKMEAKKIEDNKKALEMKEKADIEDKITKESRIDELKKKGITGRTSDERKELQSLKKEMGHSEKPNALKSILGKSAPAKGIGMLGSAGKKGLQMGSRATTAIGESLKEKKIEKGGKSFKDLKSKGMMSESSIGKAGYAVSGAAKEYAGWFYHILFSIAISLAFCIIFIPSLSFFIIGLICYVLFKRAVSNYKAM